MKDGAPLAIGIDHDHYRYREEPLAERLRAALVTDIV
jgi:hypothetical protein